MNYQNFKSVPIDSKTVFLESIEPMSHNEKVESHENSLETFLSELSNLHKYSMNFEEQDEEQERLQALYVAVIERLGDRYNSEEFYTLIMTDKNFACSDIPNEDFEKVADCIANKYLSRKKKKQ